MALYVLVCFLLLRKKTAIKISTAASFSEISPTPAYTEDLLLLGSSKKHESVKCCSTVIELVVVGSVCTTCTGVTKSKVVVATYSIRYSGRLDCSYCKKEQSCYITGFDEDDKFLLPSQKKIIHQVYVATPLPLVLN